MTVLTTTSNVRGITPDAIAALITVPVERDSVAAQASTIIPTDATHTHIPLVTGDPTAAWVGEGNEITASDPTIDDLVIIPAKVAGLTVITNELAADSSPEASGIVGDGLARDIARKIDAAFFGSKGSSTVQPAGLEDLTGVGAVDAGAAWADVDAFAEALSNAETLGLALTSFVANPADALTLAQLKESTTSKRPLLTPDPTQPTRRTIQGVPLLVSSAVTAGTVWGIPKTRALLIRRNDVDLQVDTSPYFTSDRTAVRATMRVGFAFPHAAAVQKITLSGD
ncbi:phage major capsid protein [Microbacterium sp. KR10-403]|uniref:phage major capsid protein n=1 Tax=Microbacterium sp. KR10-403 TaxID=3158581 RepID=UPI0032E3E5B8